MKRFSWPIGIGLVLALSAIVAFGSNMHFFGAAKNVSADPALDAAIAKAQAQIAQHPPLTEPYISLATLYLQKARETLDSSYYTKINDTLDAATKVDPKDADILAVRAAAAMGLHHFVEARDDITRAIALNPIPAAYWGYLGDADIELGRYQEAVDSFQKMIDIRPGFNSWSRVAYIRELYGDIDGAKFALNQSIESGSQYQENIAWAYVELGKLDMRSDLSAAQKDFNDALEVLPTYSQAMEGLGKVAFATGNYSEAETQFTAAYKLLPLAQYAEDLGELAAHQKNTSKAAQQYELAQVAFDQSKQAGVDVDLEESLFLSDHDLDTATALSDAQRAYHDRPTVYAADYLAWALYKNGQSVKAATYATEAFRLGHNDPLILFHQGMIALKNGNTTTAKTYLSEADALNPYFSMQYQDPLKQTLDSLK